MPASASMDSGVCLAGLTTIVHPAATAGPILRVPIASGKFHGVMSRQGPTGWLIVSSRHAAGGLVRPAPRDSDGLLPEPAEELRRVGDLGTRLRDRLAHLERHEQRELVRPLDDPLVRAPQDLPARAAPSPPTPPAPRTPRPTRPSRPRASRPRPRTERRAARRISSTASVPAPEASRHSPPISNRCGTDSTTDCSWLDVMALMAATLAPGMPAIVTRYASCSAR